MSAEVRPTYTSANVLKVERIEGLVAVTYVTRPVDLFSDQTHEVVQYTEAAFAKVFELGTLA